MRAIATKIDEHGQRFENTLKDRERGNARFAFLEDERVRDASRMINLGLMCS